MLQMFHYSGGPPGPIKNDDDYDHLDRMGTTTYSDEGGKEY